MNRFTTLTSTIFVLPLDNVDTDQIIPARFLTTTVKEGLGANLFVDWRSESDFSLNDPVAKNSQILVAGDNFGCGSSREHAPWALLDFGFRAVISTSIADIFKNNAVKNGLLPIEVANDIHQFLLSKPGLEIKIDLENCRIFVSEKRVETFIIDGFARHCMLNGVDQLDFLLNQNTEISRFENSRT